MVICVCVRRRIICGRCRPMAREVVSAHEFHYSALRKVPGGMRFAYRVERGFGLDGEHDGIVYRNLLLIMRTCGMPGPLGEIAS